MNNCCFFVQNVRYPITSFYLCCPRVEFGYEDEEDEEGGGSYNLHMQHYGLRERELLCPILEEDNESSASGSLPNLARSLPAVAAAANTNNGLAYLPDDPLLFTEQGELQDGHYFIKVRRDTSDAEPPPLFLQFGCSESSWLQWKRGEF